MQDPHPSAFCHAKYSAMLYFLTDSRALTLGTRIGPHTLDTASALTLRTRTISHTRHSHRHAHRSSHIGHCTIRSIAALYDENRACVCSTHVAIMHSLSMPQRKVVFFTADRAPRIDCSRAPNHIRYSHLSSFFLRFSLIDSMRFRNCLT
jgi:hypothetical protein